MVSFVDVAISLVFGVLLITSPQAFTKKSSDPIADEQGRARMTNIGYVLVGVAALYSIAKLLFMISAP